jgi:hypothetical protein
MIELMVASEAFLLSLKPAYEQRKNEIITMDAIRSKFVSMYGNPEIQGHNPQSKEE